MSKSLTMFTPPARIIFLVMLLCIVSAGSAQKNIDSSRLSEYGPLITAQDTAITNGLPKGSDIRRFDDDSAVIQALITGQVEAIGANTTYNINIKKIFPDSDFEQKLVFNEQWMGIATKPGQKQLNEALNSAIDELKKSGELEAVSRKWVGESLPTFPASLPGVPYTVQ